MRRNWLQTPQACIFVVALAAACAPTQAARADPLEGADPAALNACFAAEETREALEQCRGMVTRACVEANGPGTHSDVLCSSAEADAWDALIAQETAELNRTQQYKDPARLAAANAAWSQWREAECDYWAWEEGGGSGEQVERVECAARVTADRAIALRLERVH